MCATIYELRLYSIAAAAVAASSARFSSRPLLPRAASPQQRAGGPGGSPLALADAPPASALSFCVRLSLPSALPSSSLSSCCVCLSAHNTQQRWRPLARSARCASVGLVAPAGSNGGRLRGCSCSLRLPSGPGCHKPKAGAHLARGRQPSIAARLRLCPDAQPLTL